MAETDELPSHAERDCIHIFAQALLQTEGGRHVVVYTLPEQPKIGMSGFGRDLKALGNYSHEECAHLEALATRVSLSCTTMTREDDNPDVVYGHPEFELSGEDWKDIWTTHSTVDDRGDLKLSVFVLYVQ